MNILQNINELSACFKDRETAISIGNFDGCHLGHQALFRAVLAETVRRPDLETVALTFDPHPAEVLGGGRTIDRLQSLSDRLLTIGTCGIQTAVVLNFTREIADWSPREFVEKVLVNAAHARHVVVGSDFRFGKAKAADISDLGRLGEQFGFQVHVESAVTLDGEVVSSTLVRKCISELGNLDLVARLLGRQWGFWGIAVQGDQRGRLLGFPTANLDTVNIVKPKFGVYAGWVCFGDQKDRHPIVMNIGVRPTFGCDDVKIEVHLLEKKAWDLYGTQLWVEPVKLIRSEIKFKNVDELKKQIARDCQVAGTLLI